MIAKDRRQLRCRQSRDLTRDFSERLIIWREDSQIRCGVNCINQARRLQGFR